VDAERERRRSDGRLYGLLLLARQRISAGLSQNTLWSAINGHPIISYDRIPMDRLQSGPILFLEKR
jgi:hypothetical protein